MSDWLTHSPLVFLLATLIAYRIGLEVRRRTGSHSLAQPVAIAIILLGSLIAFTEIDYSGYREGTRAISFWLGPATVALAVPLYRQTSRLKGMVTAIAVAIPIGAVVSIASAVVLVKLLDGGDELARTMAPKAATTPVAIALSEQAGGIPSLSAVFAILAGILGAVCAPAVLTLLRVRDPRTRGVAMGAASHGIGTSRSLHDDETEGAFSGLSMGLSALAISLLLPVVLHFL